jgi:hypothetical protein
MKPASASNGSRGSNAKPVNSICNSFLINLFLQQFLGRLPGREVCSSLLACAILRAEVKRIENIIVTEVSLKTRADDQAAIEQCLTEMQRLHEQMERDQEDIDRLRAETKAHLAELQAA